MISTVLPLYCVSIGKTITDAGVFLGFYSVAMIISRPFVGKWCDEKGKLKISFIGISMLILSVACTFYDSLALHFSLYQAIEGIGFSALSTALAALLIDILPPEYIVRGIGMFTVLKSLTISLGASTAVSIAEKLGSNKVFLLSIVTIVFSLLCLFPLIKAKTVEKQKTNIDNNNKIEYKGISKYIEKSAISICLLQFIFTFALTLGTSYLPSYTQSINLTGISIYYTVSAITMFLSRTLFSKLFLNINEKDSFVYGLILAIITTIAIITTRNLYIFIIISFFNAIGISLVNPTLNVKATANVDASRRGVAISTYYGALDLGSGAGATIWGMIIPIIGYQFSFVVATILLITNLLLGLLIFKKEVASCR